MSAGGTPRSVTATVRRLEEGDLDHLVAVLERVHTATGYPASTPDDPRQWIRGPRTTASWTAVLGGRPVGHVAAATAGGDRAADVWAVALEQPVEAMTVVKRLFVDPPAHGRGIGRLLLDEVVDHAHAAGLWPVLDVGADAVAPARLYRSAGFVKVGSVELRWPGRETPFLADCYVGPEPPSAASASAR